VPLGAADDNRPDQQLVYSRPPTEKISGFLGNFFGLTPVYVSPPKERGIARPSLAAIARQARFTTGATMRLRYRAFGRGAQPVLKRLANAKMTAPVFAVGLVSTVLGYSLLPQHRLGSTTVSIVRQPVELTSTSSPALPHFMSGFVFGFLEFDWPPGQVPGFGAITMSESQAKEEG
jgi:hypothetical protein